MLRTEKIAMVYEAVGERKVFNSGVTDLEVPILPSLQAEQLKVMEARIREKYPGDGDDAVDIGTRNFLRLLKATHPLQFGNLNVTPAYSKDRDLDFQLSEMDTTLKLLDPELPIKPKASYLPEEREALKPLLSQYQLARLYKGSAKEKMLKITRDMRLTIHQRLDAEGVYKKIRRITI